MRPGALLLLVIGVAVSAAGGCAGARFGQPGEYALTGELSPGWTRVSVYVEGEKAAEGQIPIGGHGIGPGRVFARQPDAPPIEGNFRGDPVEVRCGPQPYIDYPMCDVSVAGRYAGTLLFGPDGKAL
jgi:hypothetical protein